MEREAVERVVERAAEVTVAARVVVEMAVEKAAVVTVVVVVVEDSTCNHKGGNAHS